jgi:hypothetical protein
MPNSRTHARAAPEDVYHGTPRRTGIVKAPLVGAVVRTVRVAVPVLVPVMVTELVEPKHKVGGYWAELGAEVMEADSATVPVNPAFGVTVIVDVLPVVAPGAMVTAVPVIVNVGTGAVTEI